MKKPFLSVFILSLVVIFSCTKDSTSNCGTTTYKYSTEISVILTTKCNTSGCHNATAAGGLNLTAYSTVYEHRDHILEQINAGRMPQSGSPQLTTDEKTKIVSWLNACAPNN